MQLAFYITVLPAGFFPSIPAFTTSFLLVNVKLYSDWSF